MGSVDAFVAKDRGELVHSIEPANDESFQVKLGRDAQIEFPVQRVVMRLEGTGGGAAIDGL